MGAYPANDLFINLAIDVVSNPLQNINDNDSKSDIVKSVNSVLEYVHTLRERLPVNALIILLSAADVHDGPQAAKDQIEMKYEHLFPGYKPVSIFSMALSASAQGTSLLKAISSDVIRIDSNNIKVELLLDRYFHQPQVDTVVQFDQVLFSYTGAQVGQRYKNSVVLHRGNEWCVVGEIMPFQQLSIRKYVTSVDGSSEYPVILRFIDNS